jgi:hypothetical protein
MLEAGFVAANKDELNWHFRVKNKKNWGMKNVFGYKPF